jgi:leucyl-tRNA synthetase
LFNQKLKDQLWPNINQELLIEKNLNLPIQINGKMIMTIPTKKSYQEDELLKSVYNLEKIKNKIEGKKIIKVINVQDKIINIIIN